MYLLFNVKCINTIAEATDGNVLKFLTPLSTDVRILMFKTKIFSFLIYKFTNKK